MTTFDVEVPPQGPRGPKGDQGDQGIPGFGVPGPVGPTGLPGTPGQAGAGYAATSTTSAVLASTGTVTLTTQTNLAYTPGARVRFSRNSAPATYMEGIVSSYGSVTGVLAATMDLKGGTDGTYTDWNINLAGATGSLPGGFTIGTLGTQNANAVAITGGTITGIAVPTAAGDVTRKDYVDARALASRLIATSGLATGGGDLTADRTIAVPKADQASAQTGTDDTLAMTPLRTAQAIAALQLISQIASQADALAGTDNTKGMTPLRTAQAMAAGAAGGFPSGTKMLFQQTSAPTGWTKDTTHNDKVLRVVTGTPSSGGVVAFSTFFGRTSTDGMTLAVGHLPPHTHPYNYNDYMQTDSGPYNGASGSANTAGTTGATGSGAAFAAGIDCRVQYVDLIIATKS